MIKIKFCSIGKNDGVFAESGLTSKRMCILKLM